MRSNRLLLVAVAMLVSFVSASSAQAQYRNPTGGYQPLHHAMPPGRVAHWIGMLGRATPAYYQPVRVDLPSTGKVTIFAPVLDRPARSLKPVELPSPSQFGMQVGRVYRLRISHMPEFRGVELYPTVEVIDRLHPPVGQADRFPIPLQFTAEEINHALDGQLVTKIVHLEQPQRALPMDREDTLATVWREHDENLLAEADLRGRPILIIRIGGRLPDAHTPDPRFFGSGAAITLPAKQPVKTKPAAKKPMPKGKPLPKTQPSPKKKSVSVLFDGRRRPVRFRQETPLKRSNRLETVGGRR